MTPQEPAPQDDPASAEALQQIIDRADIGLHSRAPAGHRGNALRDIQAIARAALASRSLSATQSGEAAPDIKAALGEIRGAVSDYLLTIWGEIPDLTPDQLAEDICRVARAAVQALIDAEREECCKAVCDHCRAGLPYEYSHLVGWYHTFPDDENGLAHQSCDAAAIRSRKPCPGAE